MRISRPSICFITLLLWMLTSSGAQLSAEVVGDIQVSVEPIGDFEISHGYVERRVRLKNRSLLKARRVVLSYPRYDYGSGHRISRLSKTVVLEPNAAVQVSLYQPALPISNGDLYVVVDDGSRGTVSVQGISYRNYSYYSYSHDEKLNVLISRSFDPATVEKSFREDAVKLARAPLPVGEWSENWLGYSSLDGILLSGAEYDQLSAGVRQAIFRYIECGGVLVVTGSFTSEKPAWRIKAYTQNDINASHAGFGLFVECNQAAGGSLKQVSKYLQTVFTATAAPWSGLGTVREANKAFPVIEGLAFPVRGLFFTMLVFAIFMGPVNYILLARANRRIWLLWTVPALSLLGCAAILLYSFWAEGVTPSSKIETLTLLNEKAKRATTVGLSAYYAPLTLAEGLHFSVETEVLPWTAFERYGSGGTGRVLDWTHDQHLGSGWLVARVPAHLSVRHSDFRRERISVSETKDSVAIVNGLGAEVVRLWYCDAEGEVHLSERAIPAGAKDELKRSDMRVHMAPDALRGLYSGVPWQDLCKTVLDDPASYLLPNMYIAELSGTPFIADGIKGKVKKKSRSVVVGLIDAVNEEGALPLPEQM